MVSDIVDICAGGGGHSGMPLLKKVTSAICIQSGTELGVKWNRTVKTE